VPLHTGLLEKYEFQIISVMKQKLRKMTAENLTLVGVQRNNGNSAGTYFNVPEKVVSKKNISDTPVNTFNTEESGIQINNKPEFIITEKGYQIFHVLTSGEKE
jgi:hypothetical protein